MSAVFSESTYESNIEFILGFSRLIKAGFENPEGIKGSVKVYVPEYPENSFIACYSDELTIEWHNLERDVDTQVSMPISTIERVFREFRHLDWRDPEIIGTITFTGDLSLANHLAKSCQRPTDFTVARFQQIGQLHREKGYRDLAAVEVMESPTQMQILDAIQESRPVIARGLDLDAIQNEWSIDKLAESFGDAIVRVRSATQQQNMSEFVDELKAFDTTPYDNIIEGFAKPYTEGAMLPEEMWGDFGPTFFDREDFSPPQLWLGAVPTHIPTSSLHRDPYTGFLLQVIGDKRLDLYSADQEEFLYPHKAYNNYQPCWFKPEEVDFEVYPKAKKAKSISVTLKPGELLLQPAGWFHQVYALDSPNMSVSYFWRY